MASTSVLKLVIDDKEYNASLKEARTGMQHLENALNSANKTFNQVDKSVVNYVRGIGQMEAKSKTAYEKVPTLYSTNNISRIDKVKSYIGSPNTKIFSSKPQGTSGVPDVHGMNIREAVYCLEKVGLNVRFKGAGRVVGQSLSAGSSFNRGALITLALSS